MKKKKVIICGLGALGLTYANKLKDFCELKILANEERIEKYIKNPPIFNGNKTGFEYILPKDSFDADFIIISTKANGLDSAIKYIKNFVGESTLIISLINGISSEEKISSIYGKEKVIYSYFIGHSAMKTEKGYIQDGVGKIVLEPCKELEKFFNYSKIDYELSENIIYSQWVKLGVNIVLNQLSALYELTVGELKQRNNFIETAKFLIAEIKQVAQACGITNLMNYEDEVLSAINLIADDGKTSMYQDIIAKRKTEIEIFSGEIIRLGKLHNVKTPQNEIIYNKIKLKEEGF